ncbi:hypothetical protein G9A89_005408 [Geosiphon pyriformis]|nr:hypothetical protein G9A89_005408 [Geosiphon pyriformis]
MNHFQNHRGNKKHVFAITVVNKAILEPTADFILSTISTKLLIYDTTANISTTNLSVLSIHCLSIAVLTHLLTAVSSNLSTLTNSNTATKLISKWNPKAKTDTAKLEIVNDSLLTNPQFYHAFIWIMTIEFRHQNYLSLLVTSEDVLSNNVETYQTQPLTSNISPAASTKNESQAAIFPFDFDKITPVLLFSGAVFNTKPITAMYTNTKVDVDCTASTRIIMTDRTTKTPIGKINNFTFELICGNCGKKLSSISACCGDDEEYQMTTKFYCRPCIIKRFGRLKQVEKWDNKSCLACGETLLDERIQAVKCLDRYSEPVINLLDPEQFHKHYQELALTREKQEQQLEKINTQLCNHCLILCDFQYCNECNFIYNLLSYIIYTISEENEPISYYASELRSTFNSDSNSNNDNNENNSFSSIQNDNKNYDNLDSDSNPKIYIVLPDLSKEQELKWFSDNNENIMLERVHNTNAEFNLRYSGKNVIKLEPYSCTCIDLKVALEIPATTMVQLAFRSSLAKKRINIRGGIIDTEYVENIIAILQNNSEKAYVIEPNKKIAQAIFLSLVKIAQLVSVENREKLGITAREIQRFGSTGRIDVPVNMTKKEVINKEEIISIRQPISILLYDQYIVTIERKVKNQVQMFKAEAQLCELGEIRLINLHIPAKNHGYIKIPIYNNTGNIMEILKETTIRYLTTKIEEQLPNPIPNFSQLCRYMRRMLSASTRTIRTDELEKLRPTTMYATQNATQQFQ